MSAEKFIEALEERGLLSDRTTARLREQLAHSERPLTAEALAKYLVDRRELTTYQASEVLKSLGPGAASGGTVSEAQHRRAVRGPTGKHDADRDEPRDANADEDLSSSDSSIFSPHVTGRGQARADDVLLPTPAEAEGLTLVPMDDEASDADANDPAQSPPSEVAAGWTAVEGSGGVEPTEPAPKPQATARRTPADDRPARRPLGARPRPSDDRLAPGPSQRKLGRRSNDQRETKRRETKRPSRKNEWDSPLLLVGGGALTLLVLCGLTVAWLLHWESGDDLLQAARQSLNDGSYTQAISQYEQFVEKFPRHRDWSEARVWLAVARIRQAVETSRNDLLALDVSRDELEAVEEEEKFRDIQSEIAALLPRIAAGLADRAEAATDPADVKQQIEQATAALTLCNNTNYIPKSLRDESELDGVRETLEVAQRRLDSHEDLQQSLAAMDDAVAAGNTPAAYKAQRDLLKKHPELSDDESLATAVARVSAAEQSGIRFVADQQPAETTERATPWVMSLALAHRRDTTPATDTGVACVRVDAAVYGLDVASGKLLWQRPIGFAESSWPIAVGDDVLVVDDAQHELVRLEAATGALRWRQALGEKVTPPLVVGDRAFLAAESGRLYLVDVTSGTRLGYLQFAQPLRVPPAADRRGERLYLTGNHSSVYVISLADLTCLGVYYLGHPDGSIRVAPAIVLDKLALLENDGVATCRLHLLSLDRQGTITGQAAERRLTGLAAAPPLVVGRRMIVATDRGQIDVFEVGSRQGEEALTAIATREATEQEPLVRHVLVTEGNIWVGDTQLTKYAVLPTGNRLPVESIDHNFAGSTFDHALELFGKTLIHVRRPPHRAGVVVAATDTERGRSLWETDLAVPPAWSPVVDPSRQSLVVASAGGYVFHFDEAAIRSRVQDEPLEARSHPTPLPVLSAGADLGNGRAVFGAPGASDLLLLVDPNQEGRAAQWVRLPSQLACAATPFGEGVLAPMEVGQVAYLDPANGLPLATPFEPRLRPRTRLAYQPAGVAEGADDQFVIADGREKVYLVSVVDRPQPHLEALAEAKVGPYPVVAPVTVLGDSALVVTQEPRLLRLRLPKLETVSDVQLPADVVWGPYRVGERLLLATADGSLSAVSADGSIAWTVPLEHGELAGPPLAADNGVLVAYRTGTLQRLTPEDGARLAEIDVEHPLVAGPVRFLQRIVLTAHDGTLLVVEEP
jgi:outer membrane protein assembly factor BamB/TolA-binding protein